MAERMGRFLSALHSANQPNVKVGDKVKAVKGGDFSGTVEKVKKDGSVSFRHSNGKLYRTHHTNVRVVKEDTDSEGDTMQVDEAIKPKSKEDEGEYGYEGDMAMSQLRSIIRNSQAMLENLEPETDLPEWVQSKITLAKDYIETSANYLMSELEEATGPGFMLLPGAKRTPQDYRGSKTREAGVMGKQEEKPEEQKPPQTVVSRGKVFKEAMYSGPERRQNSVARKFIDTRMKRAQQLRATGDSKIVEANSPSKAEKAVKKLIDKKRKSLVNLKPETNSAPMNGNMLTQTPTSDASAPTPGDHR